MKRVHVMLEAGSADYNVFSIENTNKKSKNWNIIIICNLITLINLV